MNVLHQLAGFNDILPVLIVFFVIIAQLVKAGKRLSKGEDGSPPDPTGPIREPGDELREFLETLTGGPPRVPPYEAFVSRPAPPPAPLSKPIPKADMQAERRPKLVVAAEPTKKAGIASPRKAAHEPFSWEEAPSAHARLAPRRKAIFEQLSERESLARAMVLREILDLPLSLRARF